MKKWRTLLIAILLLMLLMAMCLAACNKEAIYTVTYYVDGAVYQTLQYTNSEGVTLPDAPHKEGYTFGGWYLDADAWQAVFNGRSRLTADISVYAKWDVVTPATYTVVFRALGTETTRTTDEAGRVVPPTTPTREGYTFVGWGYDFAQAVTANMTLEAQWQANVYVVSFDAEGQQPVAATYGEMLPALATLPTREGYTFVGYGTNTEDYYDGEGNALRAWQRTEDGLLRAQWVPNTYRVTLRGEGVSEFSRPVTYDHFVTLYVPQRAGYDFEGWYMGDVPYGDAEGNGVRRWDKTTDGELEARWQARAYTLAIDDGSGDYYTVGVTYGEAMPALQPVEARAGYAFGGYAIDNVYYYDDTLQGLRTWDIDSGARLVAQWTPLRYNVSLIAGEDETLIATVEAVFGEVISAIDKALLPAKPHYNFIGFFDTKEGGDQYVNSEGVGVRPWNVAYDTKLYAQWSNGNYTVTFDANDIRATGAMQPLLCYWYIDAPLSANRYELIGHDFVGWNTRANGSGTAYSDEETVCNLAEIDETLVLYAQWQAVSYTARTQDGYIHPVQVSFVCEGAPAPATQRIDDTMGLVYPDEPHLDGYLFGGWYVDPSFECAPFDFGAQVEADTVLYARWIAQTEAQSSLRAGENITLSADTSGTIWVAMISSATQNVRVYTESNLDTYGLLYDENMQLLDENDDGSSVLVGNFLISFYAEAYTLYYVAVRANFAQGDVILHTTGNKAPADGGKSARLTVETTHIAYDADFVLSPSTAKGYAFEGWYWGDVQYTDADGNSIRPWEIAEDAVLRARWTALQYDVSFDTQSDATPATTVVATFGQPMPAIESVPERDGYTFEGYFSQADGGVQYYNGQGVGIRNWDVDENTVLYAHWRGLPYTVRYASDSKATQVYDQIIYLYESTALRANTFVRTGYTFVGWNTIADGSGVDYAVAQVVTDIAAAGETIIMYAQWTPIRTSIRFDSVLPHPVTVTFDLNGAEGDAPEAQIVDQFAALSIPASPTREGYIFGGWYSDSQGEGNAADLYTDFDHDVTLYAKWYDISGTFGYIPLGDSGEVALSGENVRLYPLVSLLAQEIYVYSVGTVDTYGYLYDEKMVVLSSNDDGNEIDANFSIRYPVKAGKLYYVGIRAFGTVTGTTTLHIEGKTLGGLGGKSNCHLLDEIECDYDAAVIHVADDLAGYDFNGWYDAPVGGVQYVDTNGANTHAWDKTSSTTLYAQWTPKQYAVALDSMGGNAAVTEVTASYGQLLPKLNAIPTKDGKAFIGYFSQIIGGVCYYDANLQPIHVWGTLSEGTLYAQWENLPYYVAYNANGGSGSMNRQRLVLEEQGVLTANAFWREGYEFVGWNTRADGMGSNYADEEAVINLTEGNATIRLYAQWTSIVYTATLYDGLTHPVTVSFDLNGEEGIAPDAQIINAESTLAYPTPPRNEGKVFLGWYDSTACTGKSYDFTADLAEDITLYAKWGTPVNCDEVAYVNESFAVAIDGMTMRYYPFSVMVDQQISIYSVGALDVLGYLFNSKMDEIAYDDNSGDGNNFALQYNVKAGQIYYLAVLASNMLINGTTQVIVEAEVVAPQAGGKSINHIAGTADVAYNQNFVLPVPIRAGYTFVGWYLNDTAYTYSTGYCTQKWNVIGGATLIAVWNANE